MMSRFQKTLFAILRGTTDSNIPFDQLLSLLRRLGFNKRTRGSHHIFTKDGVVEILNLQPKRGLGKAYQVKQIREIILKYKLGEHDDGE